jgi:hypothetical protein
LLLAGLLALTGALTGTPALFAVDPFYLGLLRDGIHAYDRKDYAVAARDLRLACFGMLNEPKPLMECLIRLGLAQDKSSDTEGFRETFRRIAEIEERFGGYAQAEVPPEIRTALEQRLAAVIPASTLASVPAFRGLTGTKSQAAQAPAPPAEPRAPGRRAPGRRAHTPSRPPETAPDPAVSSPPAPAPAAAPQPLSDAERNKMAEARQLLDGPGKTRELRRAFDLAREVAVAHAESAAAQHLAAEAAYRLSRWKDAAAYFRRGGEPAADQPELLFYMAVALYESGDKKAAAVALQRSLPNLQRTPYVDSYAKKILG